MIIFGGYLFKLAVSVDPNLSAFSGSLFKVGVNLVVVLGVLSWKVPSFKDLVSSLKGKNPRGLVTWGILGSFSTVFYFITLDQLGVGRSTFLKNTCGAMMVFISPLMLNSEFRKQMATGAVVALIGSYFIMAPDSIGFDSSNMLFLLTGLLSGLFAAFSYIWIGEHHSDEDTWAVVYYWSLIATLFHFCVALFNPIPLPASQEVWLLLLASGLAASLGQFFLTASFQGRDNLVYGVLGYLGAAFALGFDVALGEANASYLQTLGAILIVVSSVLSIRQSNSGEKVRAVR